MEVRIVNVEEIRPLRHSVLIVGTARKSAEFAGDDDPETLHVAAYEGDRVIGCASLVPSEWEGQPAWQLRGMATDPEFRGDGVGREVLRFAEETVRRMADRRVAWCNARTGAVEFYLKQGWKAVSEEFLIEDVGPHFRMVRDLR